MALPEKHHFPLQEIATRWSVPLHDLQYYAEHGLLQAQVWLDCAFVKVKGLKKTEDGELIETQICLSSYKGYAILEPEQLRKIFRNDDARNICRYKSLNHNEWVEIYDDKFCPIISTGDLVICRMERNRFEETYNISHNGCCCERTSKTVAPMNNPSFAGRPSVMHRVMAHFKERCETHLVHASLAKEADYLFQWAEQNVTDCQAPKPKTIKNALRDNYRNYANEFRDNQSPAQAVA